MTATLTPSPSFTHYRLPGGPHFAFNSNKKMKTVLVTVTFLGNLDETVTRLALLPTILRRGTRHHGDMQSISRKLDGLFGASLGAYVIKIGEWHGVRLRLEVVNERFLPGGNGVFREALDFLREVIAEPLEVDGGFHPQFLEQEKANLRRAIESLVDNKGAYAEQRLVEEMCRDEPYHRYEQGRIEDIAGIDARSLRRLHGDVVRRYPLYVYVTGDLELEPTRELVVSALGGNGHEGGYKLDGLPAPVAVNKVREVVEHLDVNQAKLVIGFRHGVTYADRDYEALLLMNGILGGYSHSKLFQNVREKESLCYSVHSGVERTKGLLFISSGIAPENYKKALDIIFQNIEAMKRGEISAEEIQSTVLTILNSNEMLEDNLSALGDVDFVWSLHGRKLDLAAFRERIRQVSRDEIVAVARKLAHDTTYFLTSK